MTPARRFRSTARAAAVAACLVRCAAPAQAADPVLVPPLPALAPVDPAAPSADLGALRDSARPPPSPPAAAPEGQGAGTTTIQAGSFRVPGNAAALVAALSARGLPARAEPPAPGSGLSRVLVGPLPTGAARDALATLAALGLGDAFILTP